MGCALKIKYTMNASGVRQPTRRYRTPYWRTIGIRAWGEDNLYPQLVSDILAASSTAGSCLSRYSSFVEGRGIENEELAKAIVNGKGDTWDDVCRALANDLAKYGGFALHVAYNVFAEVSAVTPIHFEDLRLKEPNEKGVTTQLAYHPDWKGEETRNGRRLRVAPENVTWYDTFNPETGAVLAQMQAAGGIEQYNGQILYVSISGTMEYPTPIYDQCITSISTDAGIDNVLYRNTRNNFMTAGAFIHRRGITGNKDDDEDKAAKFRGELATFLGDTNTGAIMDITLESDDDKPEFLNFRGQNYDKDFTETDRRTVTQIYTAFKQEPWLCIRSGKVGFGGDVIADAYNVYNEETDSERRVLSRALTRVFNAWEQRKNWGDTEIWIAPKTYHKTE